MDNNPKADVLASDGLSPCGSSQQAVSPVPASIPDAVLAAIGLANQHGETLRCGDYFCADDEGGHPYGKPADCPFCKHEQNYTEMFYNGPGSPPSYAMRCGECGAQGPISSGKGRGDHYGARVDAVNLWNAAQAMAARSGETTGSTEGNSAVPIGDASLPQPIHPSASHSQGGE